MSTQREEFEEQWSPPLLLVDAYAARRLAGPAMTDVHTEQGIANDAPSELDAADELAENDGEPQERLSVVRISDDTFGDYLREIGKEPLLTAEQEVELAKRIEAGVFAAEKLDRGENLPMQLHKELTWIVTDGQCAKEQFLNANLRLVVAVSKRYKGRGMDDLDVIQEGNLGLIRAVQKFDYKKGYKFSTYAMWWIRQAITRAIADQGRTIRLPVHVDEQVKKMERISKDLLQSLDREPTAEEIADAFNEATEKNNSTDPKRNHVDAARIKELQHLGRKPESLDRSVGDNNDTTFSDLVEDKFSESPVEAAMRTLSIEGLRAALELLDYRERWVLTMRFGLDNGVPMTLDEVGEALGGITRSKVQTIEKKALAKLRDPIIADKLRGLLD